jgi:hypothetical protein
MEIFEVKTFTEKNLKWKDTPVQTLKRRAGYFTARIHYTAPRGLFWIENTREALSANLLL